MLVAALHTKDTFAALSVHVATEAVMGFPLTLSFEYAV